jgi:putative nucleotidyltransferase with HDIG domain
MGYTNDPTYGQGEHAIRNDAILVESAQQFARRLRAHFASPGYSPPLLPAVALEVHSLAQQPEVDADKVVAIMRKDPMLAGRVLKIAQSAAFAPTTTITSLRDAVVRLGLRNLSEIAWEVSLGMRVFRSAAYSEPMEMVRRHSTACAHLARLVASFTPIASEYAFLCGLLHDVGMAAALILLGEQKNTGAGLELGMLAMALRQSHQELSAVVARLWRLPQDVQLVLGHHHEVVINGLVHPLAAVVALAEELTREVGLGIVLSGHDCDMSSDTALAQARNALGFDQARMEKVKGEVKKLIATLERGAASAAVRAAEDHQRPEK